MALVGHHVEVKALASGIAASATTPRGAANSQRKQCQFDSHGGLKEQTSRAAATLLTSRE
jgi:hypothetical protein